MRSVLFVASFFLTLPPLPGQGAASTQPEGNPSDSRSEDLKERRREKQANPPEVEPNKAEETLLRFEKGQVDRWVGVRYKDFYPQFGVNRPGAGFGGGVRYFKSNIRKSGTAVEASGQISTRGYKIAGLQVGRFNKTDPIFFFGTLRFRSPL